MHYIELDSINNDQAKVIREKGWCVYTVCADGSTEYYNKGFSWVNRIGYLVVSEDIDVENPYKVAEYSDTFREEVDEALEPIKDKCYVFLVMNPMRYDFQQVWTNKGLDEAKRIAKIRFAGYKYRYYTGKDHYKKMHKIIDEYNAQRESDRKEALELLKANGFEIISSSGFAVEKKGE